MADKSGTQVPEHGQVPKMRSVEEVDQMLRHGNSFDAMLFKLMNKADQSNWRKLRRAFPTQAAEYSRWFGHDPLRSKLL